LEHVIPEVQLGSSYFLWYFHSKVLELLRVLIGPLEALRLILLLVDPLESCCELGGLHLLFSEQTATTSVQHYLIDRLLALSRLSEIKWSHFVESRSLSEEVRGNFLFLVLISLPSGSASLEHSLSI
jgi:hypothetical protein